MLYHITNSKQDTERLGSRFTLPSQLRRAPRVFFFHFLLSRLFLSIMAHCASLCCCLRLFFFFCRVGLPFSFFFFRRMLVVKAVPLNREMPLRDTQNTNRTSKLDFVFVDVGADLVFFSVCSPLRAVCQFMRKDRRVSMPALLTCFGAGA